LICAFKAGQRHIFVPPHIPERICQYFCATMVHPFIDIHCHAASTSGKIALVSQYVSPALVVTPPSTDSAFISLGIHPWYTSEESFDSQWEFLEKRLQTGGYAAVGECGLDRLKGPPLPFQSYVLLKHCQLAADLDLPVVLHIVKAFSDLLTFQKKHRFPNPKIVHGFRGNRYEAEQLIRYGFHLSFGEALLHGQPKLEDAFLYVPLDKIFLETDTSIVSIEKIYEKAAQLKRISVDELIEQITNNFEAIR
jgi:TatD DNase family protein